MSYAILWLLLIDFKLFAMCVDDSKKELVSLSKIICEKLKNLRLTSNDSTDEW